LCSVSVVFISELQDPIWCERGAVEHDEIGYPLNLNVSPRILGERLARPLKLAGPKLGSGHRPLAAAIEHPYE
jgi:hypothetical protein